MKKNVIVKIIVTAVLIALIVASIALYVVDIILNNTPPTENLFKALAAVFICLGSLVRMNVKKGRRSLSYYESRYYEQIKNAFVDSPMNKKKLLCAIRLYNEDNFGKALKYLNALKQACKTRDDLYVVGLFTALVFTDANCYEDAIYIYNALLNMNITSSTIYGNLGHLYSGMGNHKDAISMLHLSIQNDENNPSPYHNLAKLYFDTYDFENAKKYATKALDINQKFRPSASLLAIIYSLEDDNANYEKYFHIAISCGEDPARLQSTIKRYQTEMAQKNTDGEPEAEDEEQ